MKKDKHVLRVSLPLTFLFVGLVIIAVLVSDLFQRVVLFGIYALAVVAVYIVYIFRIKDVIQYVATYLLISLFC